MIGNIKETFLSKTGMWKKQVLQDPGYVKGVEGLCCMLSCKVVQIYSNTNCPMLNVSKEIKK